LTQSSGHISSDVPLNLAEQITVHDDSARVESSLDMERLLAEVPAKTRQAIQCVKLDGLSVSKAAAKSGIWESAVKVSVHRGLKALTTFINKER